ncbi:MAG: HAD family hydrolase [Terriglobales bacterium]
MPASAHNGAFTLLIDADDTLWENNIYFERVIARFFQDFPGHSPRALRQTLDDVEREIVLSHGYGLSAFEYALVRTCERLAGAAPSPEREAEVRALARSVNQHPMEILPGVPETLAYLASRYSLILMSKGDPGEQSAKLERSGLRHHFSAVEIVPEKDPDTYRDTLARHGLAAFSTWMIGNSPKSDVNPALAAGLNAVFVPHDQTWVLEHEHLSPPEAEPPRLLVLERFAELQEHF